MNLPKFRLSRKDTAPVAEPDPADMGTCFGLDMAMTAAQPTRPARDAGTAEPQPRPLRHERVQWRLPQLRRG